MANNLEIKKGTTAPQPRDVADGWQQFRREMDRLFDRMTDGFPFPMLRPFANLEHFWPQGTNGFAAAVDLTGDDKTYKITAEFPGLDEKDVEVTVGDDYVTIKGEKHEEKEDKAKDKYMSERTYGLFQRTFALPVDIDRKAIDAKFAKGVLTVTLPKAAKAEPSAKKIEVKAA